MVISASPVKRKRQELSTRKGEQWSSPLRWSSVNVGYLRHERANISALPVKRQCRALATRKGGQWSSPLCRSSVNVGHLRHGRADSGHLRFAGQASMSGTCDTEGQTVVISALSFAHLRHSHTRLVGCETEIEVSFAIDETFSCSSQ